MGNQERLGPEYTQYGSRFPGTEWENANTRRRVEHGHHQRRYEPEPRSLEQEPRRYEHEPQQNRYEQEPHRYEPDTRRYEPPRLDHYNPIYEPDERRAPTLQEYNEPRRVEREPFGGRQNMQRNQPRVLQVRVDFPRFDGRDPLDWIFLAEEYFTCQQIIHEDWIQTAILHLDGLARKWYRWLKHHEGERVLTWDGFKDALLLRFGESAYVDYDIELRNLRQIGTVQEYQTRFESLASMVDWTPKSLIAAFIGGLKEEIQIDIRAERNEVLRTCYAKARAIEERHKKLQNLYKPWRNVQGNRPREAPQQRLLPAPPKKVEQPKPTFRARALPPMTNEERELLIKNKQCFWCKEKWDHSHRCKHIRVYTVLEPELCEEGDHPPMIEEIYETESHKGEEPPTEPEPTPDCEIRMMSEEERPNAMKILGWIGDKQVLVLLDSGATHNFVGEHIVDHLGTPTEEQVSLKVLVADGGILSCTRKCLDVELYLQNAPIKVDLLVVPIPSVDIILGVKWLKTIGRTWWDFSTMEMCLPKEGGGEEILKAIDPNVAPRVALRAVTAQRAAADGKPHHEVMIEWEGIDGGTSWELFDRIKTQFPMGAWGQAPSQEGGFDTGPSTSGPQAAPGTPENSPRRRDKAAIQQITARPSPIDPRLGQDSELAQLGSVKEESSSTLEVSAEGGEGGQASASSEGN
ncbi:hypothetical protein EJ110_NYTH14420 [Nymphaea thermarum]|nr:hypothetical protein EJ110_NYTH14420 [Nymphaea thermarum]